MPVVVVIVLFAFSCNGGNIACTSVLTEVKEPQVEVITAEDAFLSSPAQTKYVSMWSTGKGS